MGLKRRSPPPPFPPPPPPQAFLNMFSAGKPVQPLVADFNALNVNVKGNSAAVSYGVARGEQAESQAPHHVEGDVAAVRCESLIT